MAGNELKDEDHYLTHGTNKKVFYKIYKEAEEIDEMAIVKLLKEAVKIDRKGISELIIVNVIRE